MNACVIFSAESERRVNAYRGALGHVAVVEVCGDEDEVIWSLVLSRADARDLGETLCAIARQIEEDE